MTRPNRKRKLVDKITETYNPDRPMLEQLDGNIPRGSHLDNLRKEILKEIVRGLYVHFNPKMNIVPCKEHLFEKGVHIEKSLFKTMPLKRYANSEIIKNTTCYVANQHQVSTVKV